MPATGGSRSRSRSRTHTVLALGTAQTLAWASSYYLPAMLAAPMARDLGVATPTVFAAFSMALIVSALAGPLAGRLIDRHGGRPVLLGSNVLFALALVLLGSAQGPATLVAAWLLLGLGMGAGLYEAGFAALVRLYGSEARSAITGITLLAGFASTVGWPLSAWMEVQIGWRGACFVWAGLHVVLGLPLNALLPRAGATAAAPAIPTALAPAAAAPVGDAAAAIAPPPPEPPPPPPPRHAAALLSLVFALAWFVNTAMAAHLPTVIQAAGGTLALAVAVGALVGPAQVAGRLFEFGFLRRISPLAVARAATLGHPLGALLLWALGAPVAAVYAILHGLGAGIMTIAKGTLPLAFFGAGGYGARQGWIALPGRALQGLSPWLFGMALEHWGVNALWLSAAVSLAACAVLLSLRLPRPALAQPTILVTREGRP
ncbi:MAG: MFS transporter [Rubrivivax sp.]|nr:MFS transporter [Rubrivivax sp.]